MLNDPDLDELLTTSAPGLPGRPDDVAQALLAVARDAEHVGRVPRWRRRALVAGIAVVAVVGVGGAAAASGLVPGWTPWRSSDGTQCQYIWQASPAGLNVSPPEDETFVQAFDDPATVEAQAFLDEYDVDSAEHEAAFEGLSDERIEVAEAHAAAAGVPFRRSEFESHVRDRVVREALQAHLRAEGLDPDSVDFGGVEQCDQ